MSAVRNDRYTADWDESFVVFIIGMRINHFWAVHKWLPVFTAMRPMVNELYQHPELGFLHTEYLLHWRGVTLRQYWRSYEALAQYAHGSRHLEAWKTFNQAAKKNQAVGIYHESYIVEPGHYECVYSNMPAAGLPKATHRVPARGERTTAKQRLNLHSDS